MAAVKSSLMPLFVNKVLFIQSHSLVYILSMVAFRQQGQSRIVATETAWPEKPKIFASKHFTENICQNLSQIVC